MTTIVKLNTLPTYPDEYISRSVLNSIASQGLIAPILITPNGQIYHYDVERYMAFRQLAEVDDIIVCYWDELDKDEKTEYPLNSGEKL